MLKKICAFFMALMILSGAVLAASRSTPSVPEVDYKALTVDEQIAAQMNEWNRPEMRVIQESAIDLDNWHYQYKTGSISIDEYEYLLKSAGKSQDYINRARKTLPFDVEISDSHVSEGQLQKGIVLANYTLGVTHVTQSNGYYCGPASAYMALKYAAPWQMTSKTQSDLASELGTSASAGTDWYLGGSGPDAYPMWKVFDSYLGVSTTSAMVFNNSVTSTNLTNRIVRAIDLGYPIAYNMQGSMNGQNYPSGHWMTIIGYKNYGSTLVIADPAKGLYGLNPTSAVFETTVAAVLSAGMWKGIVSP